MALGPVALKILKPNSLSGVSLLVFSIICFLFYHPIAVEGRFINTLKGNRTTEHCITFISSLNDKDIVIISERPGQYTALGYGTVNFDYANKQKDNLLKEYSRNLFSKIYAFQEIEYSTLQPTKGTALPSNFKTNTRHEIQISAIEFLRISEVEILNESP